MTQSTRLRTFAPIFPVRDLAVALAHYATLGFAVHPYADGDEYGFADRDGIGLHFVADAKLNPAANTTATYLYVEDADALYAEWCQPGVAGVTHLVGLTEYHLREGSHLDPDNNLIRFGSPPTSP